jgi:single-strand DNA-binding protein
MNKCIFIGRLTKDPEISYSTNQTAIAKFTLAVNRKFKQEGQPTADFLNFVAFGKTAEFIGKYFEKGSGMGVTSRVQNRNWDDQEGKKHYATDFVVEEVDFAGSKGNSNPHDNLDVPPADNSDDDLPF